MDTPFTAETLWRLPRVGNPEVAADTVVVPVTTHPDNRPVTRLWLVDPDGGDPRPLTNPGTSARNPRLSPDGSRVAFVRDHEGRPQLWVMPLHGGEGAPVTDLPLGVHGAVWMPDGSGLIVVADLYADHPTPADTAAERDRRAEEPVRVNATEHAVYRYWDTWLTGREVPHLFRLDLDRGDPVDLTPDATRWMRWAATGDPTDDVAVSPDGRRVVFCADVSEPPHRQVQWGLLAVDLDNGTETDLAPDLTGHALRPRYAPDGTLVWGMQRQPDFYADRVRLVVDRPNGERAVLTEDWDRSAAGWSVNDGEILLAAEEEARQHLWRLDLGGGTPERIATGGTLTRPRRTRSGSVVAGWSTLSRPPEVARIDDGRPVPITGFCDPVMADVELGSVEETRFQAGRGDEVQAWLIHPPAPPEDPPPLVHMIHGGPHSASGDGWHWRWNAHAFAAPGYVVAQVNFHGSTGFGQEFAESIQGAWGELPTDDIEAATDHLIASGMVDPERMAITGGSYGGYLVAWLIGHTDRYACAVAHAAVTDLAAMYATDITLGRARAYGAEVWEDPARIDRWSPAAHAAGYTTPTLVIHGERDYRVPVTQGLELYGVLKAKGVDARLVHYPEENHWVLSRAASLHWHDEVLSWLRRWL